MRQKNMKVVMCAVTAVLTFSSIDISANAATNVSMGQGTGQEGSISNNTAAGVLNEVMNNMGTEEAASQPQPQALDEAKEDLVIEETKEVDISLLDEKILRDVQKKLDRKDEEEGFKSLVIAKVNDYVNVRSIPSEEGEIIGKTNQ